MKWKLADGTEVDLGDVTLDALMEADPTLKEAHGKAIKDAIDRRFKADAKKPKEQPPAPVIPPEVEEQLKELAELREFKAKLEDSQKTEAQRTQEALLRAQQAQEKIRQEEQKKVEAERRAREAAEAALDAHMLDSEIAAWLVAKNKGIGLKQIPKLVRDNFKKIDGKFVAEDPETGAMVGVEEFLPSYLKQPGNEIFQPPPVAGTGLRGGGRAGEKPPENLTAGQWFARAIAERTASGPTGVAHAPQVAQPAPSTEPPQ